MKQVVCFYIPEPHFRFFLSPVKLTKKRKKNTVISGFTTDFTVENAPT